MPPTCLIDDLAPHVWPFFRNQRFRQGHYEKRKFEWRCASFYRNVNRIRCRLLGRPALKNPAPNRDPRGFGGWHLVKTGSANPWPRLANRKRSRLRSAIGNARTEGHRGCALNCSVTLCYRSRKRGRGDVTSTLQGSQISSKSTGPAPLRRTSTPLAKSPGVCRILDASQADTQPDSSLAFRKSSFRLYTLSGYHGYGLAREGSRISCVTTWSGIGTDNSKNNHVWARNTRPL